MTNKMLIDADHAEETRVVILKNGRVEEFDYETQLRRQLRGNIYLAKVTRVEPSLQAAFVDYGGNRHGFLAFNEIHPDYYQIPVADREALLAQEAELDRNEKDDDDEAPKAKASRRKKDAAVSDEQAEDTSKDAELDSKKASNKETSSQEDDGELAIDESDDDDVESVGSEDALEELPKRRVRRRHYKIQEVIKRHQIILIQVVKEERGNKGAALTTYISLAGRYTVLMPNTGRGGGISRKIGSGQDRRRLRDIIDDLAVQEGMGLIVRTAGASRTKPEIKRDYDYLLRLWENVRALTLQSTAPALVYEEGNLIKRAIRDLYTKDIDEVSVAGNEAYKEAKAFMRMLMPNHAKNVQPYKDKEPLFSKHRIETQLNNMYSPHVTLKSGGYIVINQTEALVAVDVNSGRATKQFSIEDTALNTNVEAAAEVARQLRLRDMAGLVVIDFIDMEERRNNRTVERALKDALKEDRARIQVGRISAFGLLEMSRQRLRAGMMEGTTSACPHCQGTGIIRSIESLALNILREAENWLQTSNRPEDITVKLRSEVALYILNSKRDYVHEMEGRHGVTIQFTQDNAIEGANFKIVPTSGGRSRAKAKPSRLAVQPDSNIEATDEASPAKSDEAPRSRRRRSRGGRNRGRGRRDEQSDASANDNLKDRSSSDKANEDQQPNINDDEKPRSRSRGLRRRGRRGGRRVNKNHDEQGDNSQSDNLQDASGTTNTDGDKGAKPKSTLDGAPASKEKPSDPKLGKDSAGNETKAPRAKKPRAPRKKAEPADKETTQAADTKRAPAEAKAQSAAERLTGKKAPVKKSDAEIKKTPAKKAEKKPTTRVKAATSSQSETVSADVSSKRRGWWQKT